MDCPNLQKNKDLCSCKNKNCPLHGKCCECMMRHKESKTYPHCFDDAECITMKEKIASFSPKVLESVKLKMKENAVEEK